MSKKNRGKKNNSGKQRGGRAKGGMRVQPFGSVPLLPPNHLTKLAYAEKVVIFEPVLNGGASTSFSLNSLFDPNTGGVGVQPLYFDQISAMYGQYRVWGAKVKVIFCNTSLSNTSIMASIFGTFQPAVPSNPDAWVCQPYGRSGDVEPVGGRSNKTFTIKFDLPTILGLKREQYRTDMDFIGTPSGNPTRQAYMMIGLRSLGGAVGSAQVHVQIEYTAEFSQPLALNMS